MDKFVISNKQNITQNLDENITNEQEIHQKELEDNEMIQLQNVTVTFTERSFSFMNNYFSEDKHHNPVYIRITWTVPPPLKKQYLFT